MSDGVTIERRGAVLEITLDRPKVNAIDHATSRAMGEGFALLRDDPDLRVGIITGAGERCFSAGWDLKDLEREGTQLQEWWTVGDYGQGGFAGLTEMWNLNKPVIAALNGLTVGGGLELALSSDLIIAADHVELQLPEMPLGLVPDAGAIQRLPRRLPYNIAMEMFLLGRRMPAGEAKHYGLINEIVPHAELMDKARDWADRIAAFAPNAVQSVKEILRAIECEPVEKAFDKMRTDDLPVYRRMLSSSDAAEGVKAFVEKRPARFTGK